MIDELPLSTPTTKKGDEVANPANQASTAKAYSAFPAVAQVVSWVHKRRSEEGRLEP